MDRRGQGLLLRIIAALVAPVVSMPGYRHSDTVRDRTKKTNAYADHQHFSPAYSVQFSCSVVSNSLQPQELQRTRIHDHHQLPRLAQTYVPRVGDAIQPSSPL